MIKPSIILHSCDLPRVNTVRDRLLLPLTIIASFSVWAATNGITLPDSYRTPLSDMVYDEHQAWREPAEEDNPWREQEEDVIINPRLKTEFFPEWDYNTVEDPASRSLFQNEFELERPRTNIFKYTF